MLAGNSFLLTEGVTLSGARTGKDCKLIALWRSLIKFRCRRGNAQLRKSLRQKDKVFVFP